MDGQVSHTSGATGVDETGRERENEVGAAYSSGISESEFVPVEGNLDHLRILDDDFEQPDGQRSSLSLEDDGGSHFELYSQETVVRRGESIQNIACDSPTQQEESDDNDVAFNPVQRLNFDDDDDDEDNDDDNEGGLELAVDAISSCIAGDREYILNRPYVNGSDMTEMGTHSNMLTAHDQGQNVRIIEGHDSSLLDDGGNSAFGFNFPQTQMVQFPLLSPVNMNSSLGNNRMEDEAHNLYDSLEREDGSSLYGEADEHLLESNSSEYLSAGSMSLVVASSQVPDCDSLWAQDDSPEHGNFLPHPQQHLHNGHGLERTMMRRQSPPRNFQNDVSNKTFKRRTAGFMGEGNIGGYGDVHGTEEDNTDALTLELSEEGLSQTSQMSTHPVIANSSLIKTPSAGSTGARDDVSASHNQSQNDWISSRALAHCNIQMCSFDNATSKLVHQGVNNSQQRIWGQGLPRDEPKAFSHVEGDGVDTQSDERQTGAGKHLTTNQKLPNDMHQPSRKPALGKIQTRRPAVQGSASSGDNKRSVAGNPRQGTVPSRKAVPPVKSGSHSDAVMRGGTTFSRQNIRGEQSKGNSSGASDAGYIHSVASQGQASAASIVSRSSSHASLASNSSSTNNRIGGVGKESHMVTNPTQGGAPAARTELNNHNASEKRPDFIKGDTMQAMVLATQSGTTASQVNQHLHSVIPQACDQTRQGTGFHSEPHIPHLFGKQGSSVFHSQFMPMHGDHINEPFNCRVGDQQLLSSHDSSQLYHNVGGIVGSSRNPQNLSQHSTGYPQQGFPIQHQSYGYQMTTHQGYQTGCHQAQASHPCGGSPSSLPGSQHSSREASGIKMKATKQVATAASFETNSHSSQLDNDIHDMEEVRSHLHSMLNIGTEASVIDHHNDDHFNPPTDQLLQEQPLKSLLYFDADSSSFMGSSHQDDMSDIFENFPTFSSKIFSDMPSIVNRHEAASLGENQYLRDSLEKEKYRRKHCEEHIQKQNAKLLEVQQQLAVAVSTDKRKDIMIEQLDKQLAKVVEGWKKREAEKDEYLKVLTEEKAQIEGSLQNQQNMISNFERELSQAVEELREEKEKSAQTIRNLKDELSEAQREKEHLAESLRSVKDQNESMKSEWDNLKTSKELAEKRAENAQERLIQEQENSTKKELEHLAKINDLQESNQKIINLEKVKLEEQKKRREEAETQSEELKTELKKAVLDMEQLIRERETQKVEMAIMEAKFENAQRKLEADLHTQMEKEIADQAAEFHSRIESSLEEAADRHRKQIGELHSRHQRDIEHQADRINEERQKKEEEYQKQLNELEEKLQEVRSENMSLRQSKIKLESQRMEILTKLQFMMQSQWNEAVSLLVTTPQKKSLNSSFMSSQSGGQLASAMAVTDSNTSMTSINFGSLGSHGTVNQDTEGQENRSADSIQHHSAAAASAGLENCRDERHEEINRMDRIEEYLQRLPHHMDIPMMTNELQTPAVNPGSHPGDTQVIVSNNAGHSYGSAAPQQQQQQRIQVTGHGSIQEFNDCQKPSNNLSQAHVHGYITGPNGKTLITTSGHIGDHMIRPMSGHMGDHVTRLEPMFQAVAMRSPQQSTSRYSSDSNQHSGRCAADPPSVPGNHQYVINSQPGLDFVSQPHNKRYNAGQVHHEQKPQPSAQHQPQVNSSSHSEMGPLTGDFGDHKEVKLLSGSVGNINLYRSESPAYISNPATVTANHWSPSNDIAVRCYPNVPSLTSGLVSSPGQSTLGRPHYSSESPAKKHSSRSHQQARHIDELKESLSPPVKQKAKREHSDKSSDTSSECPSLDRSHGNFSSHGEEQMTRQGELQHYVRMLLQKAPGSVCSEPERDLQFSDQDILESSRDITVDFDLNDTATAAELTTQLSQLQHLRERQAFTAQNRIQRMQEAPSASQSNESILSQLSELFDDTGVISSQHLSEISRLLNMYRDPPVPGQVTTTQLLDVHRETISSIEHISKMDNKRSQGIRNSPKSQQSSKARDLTKTQRIRSESQSADSGVSVNAYSLDKSTSSKSGSQSSLRKGNMPPTETKDKKTGVMKQSGGGRNSGGPAWK